MGTGGKKVLLLSYRFPPWGGGGVQRTLKFTRYLPEFGWQPIVHTSRNPDWPIRDESLLAQVPVEAHVYRTPALEFERFAKRLMALGGAKTGRPSSNGHSGPVAPRAERAPGAARGGLARRMSDAVESHVLIPDAQIAWLPAALIRSLWIARREEVSLVFTTSPPNSIHLLGRLVARAIGRPWVADFRDPWTDGMRRRRAYVGNPRRARREAAAEERVIRDAAHVIVTAEPLRERFLEKYPFLSPDRVSLITNGYDPADYPGGSERRLLEPGRFHLVGTGNIEADFDAQPLFRAVAALVAEGGALGRELVVTLVGAKRGKYDAALRELGLAERVRYPGWVPYRESLRYLEESDALLMCAITQTSGRGDKLPAKGFEYLWARKPVLCLSAPGEATDLLRDAGLGVVVDPADEAGIKNALRDFHAARDQPSRANTSYIERFDRRRLTGTLAEIFDRLAGA
jgi:glycosyltransferase involved in cell wall biosynthesis